MRTLYQLRARGGMKSFDREHTLFSKRVFTSQEVAETFIPQFRALVTGDRFDDLMDDARLKITTVEIELSED
jgi:hypothetical protein